MKKKYTIEELKEIFDKVKLIALESLMSDFEKEAKEVDGLGKLAFNMQNIIAIATLEKEFFKEID